jgi:hypothetical protein
VYYRSLFFKSLNKKENIIMKEISEGQKNAIIVADMLHRSVVLCQLNVDGENDKEFVEELMISICGLHTEFPELIKAFEKYIQKLRDE